MHWRTTKVKVIAATGSAAALVGCALWALHAPSRSSPNQYIAANFVFQKAAVAEAAAKFAAKPTSETSTAVAQTVPLDRSTDPAISATDVSLTTATDGATPTPPAGERLPLELATATASLPQRATQAVRILQLGDSHTAADYFTGELRRRLQARFGIGGSGYLAAGKPHLGIRTGLFKIAASDGWTYQALQKSDSASASAFWLSGFNAVSATPGHSITYSSDAPVSFDAVEIEAVRQPHGGTIEVRLDGVLKGTFALNGAAVEPIVFRLRPKQQPVERMRQLEIKTTGDGPVVISSVAIYNNRSGVTLSAVGFPGATISVLNKLAPDLFADDLRRIDPQIVILAFGTNEASNDKLSPQSYGTTYQGVIDKIKAALPAASVVILGPPDGEEHGQSCKTASVEAACRAATSDLPKESGTQPGSPAQPDNASEADCSWHQLPKLTEVRDAQRDIASRGSYAYWNWASIMPEQCGAQHWVTASPPLMTPDHIHFTHDGYAKSADAFLPTLLPLVEKYGAGGKAASSE
jgi:lysophospholipase L1-like esterase